MPLLYLLAFLAAVLALGYFVMLYRLWRRTGTVRVSSFWPQSTRGRVRVSLLVAGGIAVIVYVLLTHP